MFRLSASRVTVPAHGTADVTLTIDGSGSAGGRAYSGQILATDADARNVAHTAVSAGPVRHKLTVHFKDADGNPVPGVFDLLKSGTPSRSPSSSGTAAQPSCTCPRTPTRPSPSRPSPASTAPIRGAWRCSGTPRSG